jgi:hypothetical protein
MYSHITTKNVDYQPLCCRAYLSLKASENNFEWSTIGYNKKKKPKKKKLSIIRIQVHHACNETS